MTLKQLEALFWAGTLGSFALAAERLSMTQSSLSKRILELEEELGVKLFDRSGQKARITDVGKRLLLQAQEVMNLRDAILVTARGKYGLRGTCKFGVSELVAVTWLADLVAEVRRTYPEVTLEPRIAVAQELLADVQRGDTDFAIGPGSSPDVGIASKHLVDVQMVWVCAPDLLPHAEVFTAEMLQQHPVISMSAQSAVTAALDNWAVARSLKFKRIVASNSMSAVAALAASGIGICMLPAPFARNFIHTGKLRAIPMESGLSAPMLGYFLNWRRDDTGGLSLAVREICLRVALRA